MASSSQPSACSQKTVVELTPAQLKRRLAVQAAMAKFAAEANAAKTAGAGPSTAAAASAPVPLPLPPPPPTPEEAAENAEQKAIDDKVVRLSPSQRSLFNAGLYLLPAEKKAKLEVVPAEEGSTSTSDVKPVVPVVPKITPVGRSQSWLTGGDTEGDAIELDSSDDDAPATRSAAAPAPSTGTSTEAAVVEETPSADQRKEKLIAQRRRASAKRARSGFDTDSSEEEKDADVKPSREVKARTQQAVPSRVAKATGSRVWLAIPEPKESKPKPAVPEGPVVVLSAEQETVQNLIVRDGVSLFFTGSAGTGKSVLLRELIKSLRDKYPDPGAVCVTASTGIAAVSIGGSTVHSFAGIGLGLEDVHRLAGKIRGRKEVLRRWRDAKVWIIDELSMLDGRLFDKLAALGSILRGDKRPFGGIQMVVCGDFLQLPPVTQGSEPVFAFEGKAWYSTIMRCINLTEVFRQKDQRFVDMLNEMRFGQLSQRTIETFSNMSRPVQYPDGLEPTELFSHRAQVETANLVRLRALTTEDLTFPAYDSGMLGIEAREKVLNNMMAPQLLSLKVGAQVMLIKNKTTDLVNGSIGTVVAFTDRRTYIDAVYGSLAGVPPAELAGYGVSRRQALDDLDEEGWIGDDDGDGFNKVTEGGERFPLVKFSIPGGNFREILIEREEFKVETPDGQVAACRRQVPLILSWAMSIHKSQGQTLQRMRCDLGKIFEKGQAYVALSRATSLETLQILNFRSEKVMSHPRVAEWNKRSLETLKIKAKPKM